MIDPIIVGLFSLSACLSEQKQEAEVADTFSQNDPFDDSGVTEDDLEKSFCMVIEDLRFVKGEEKDHAFVISNGTVSKHKSFAKVKPVISTFEATVGMPLFEAMDVVGMPSFRGRYDISPTLTYVLSSDSYVNVHISKGDDNKWFIASYDTYNEEQFSDYFGKSYDYSNKEEIQQNCYAPSLKRVRSILMGSLFEETLFVLGMPDLGTYHGKPSTGKCSGRWHLQGRSEVTVGARWIESDYPMFDSRNCENGSSTYCGVYDINIYN